MTTRTTRLTYWASTGVTVIVFAGVGIANLARVPAVVENVTHLGYPAYLTTILGICQILGAIAVASPADPRLKEWAYAGMFFNLAGAAASHASSGDPFTRVLVPLVLLAVVMTSWALRSAHASVAPVGVSSLSPSETSR